MMSKLFTIITVVIATAVVVRAESRGSEDPEAELFCMDVDSLLERCNKNADKLTLSQLDMKVLNLKYSCCVLRSETKINPKAQIPEFCDADYDWEAIENKTIHAHAYEFAHGAEWADSYKQIWREGSQTHQLDCDSKSMVLAMKSAMKKANNAEGIFMKAFGCFIDSPEWKTKTNPNMFAMITYCVNVSPSWESFSWYGSFLIISVFVTGVGCFVSWFFGQTAVVVGVFVTIVFDVIVLHWTFPSRILNIVIISTTVVCWSVFISHRVFKCKSCRPRTVPSLTMTEMDQPGAATTQMSTCSPAACADAILMASLADDSEEQLKVSHAIEYLMHHFGDKKDTMFGYLQQVCTRADGSLTVPERALEIAAIHRRKPSTRPAAQKSGYGSVRRYAK